MPNIAIFSHGHPELSQGGAERASYALHCLIKDGGFPGWRSTYVSRAEHKHIGHDGDFGAFRGRTEEILVALPPLDHFFQSSLNAQQLYQQLDEIFENLKPDLVHIHHFVYWGLELIEYFHGRKVPIIFTFHEYLSICHRSGQMLKTNGRLCSAAFPSECGQCFPEISSGFFFLRHQRFLEALRLADALISPSEFLAERVRGWSKDLLRVEVVENPRRLADYESSAPCYKPPMTRQLRIGYFGQINPFKGVDILLDAVQIALARGLDIRLCLFGANLEIQDPIFREKIEKKITALDDHVEFFGPYKNSSVIRLMQSCSAVVVPSIWWENSPVVIQEAVTANVMIFGSRHGGMEEKLKSLPNSVLFEPGSSVDLADKLIDFYSRQAKLGEPAAQAMHATTSEYVEKDWLLLKNIYQRVYLTSKKENAYDLELRAPADGGKSDSKRPSQRKRKNSTAS
ncbi:glycosyltransferase [uncultured Pseudacidovorax sp.]|uniref:glycosyltransferase n=1 Tax=uncultured Pseudacidovorax sp. TaxID=679313 RepID=UPI0025E1F58A|nr:glycosyltransferase [uncultured Pseudacidovorax sp.]